MLNLLAKIGGGAVGAGGKRKRAPRDFITCSATILVDNRFHRAELRDVSSSGCKVSLEEPQPAGKMVQIALENWHSLGGTVRWYREGLAGIQFIRPLSDSALTKWKRAIVNASPAEVVEERHKGPRDFWGDRRNPG